MHSSLFTLSLTLSLSCPLVKLHLSGGLSAAASALSLALFFSLSAAVACRSHLSTASLLPSLLLQLPLCFLCCCLCCRRWSEPVGAACWCLLLARVLERPRARVTRSLLLGCVAQLLQFWYFTRQYLVLGNFDTWPAGTWYLAMSPSCYNFDNWQASTWYLVLGYVSHLLQFWYLTLSSVARLLHFQHSPCHYIHGCEHGQIFLVLIPTKYTFLNGLLCQEN